MSNRPVTRWVTPETPKAPFKGLEDIKTVKIPDEPRKRKGHTMYDAQFERLMEFKDAIQVPVNGFDTIRRAMQRFIKFRNLTGTVCLRQVTDKRAETVTIWLEKK